MISTETEARIEVERMTIANKPTIEDLVGHPRKFAENFMNSVKYEGYYYTIGTHPDKTFLLYGPPGTGKTMTLNAINNSFNFPVMAKLGPQINNEKTENKEPDLQKFPLLCFKYDIGKYGTAFINRGSRIVQEFFDKVGTYSAYGMKTIIILDEADALLGSRKSGVQCHAEDRKVLETIMTNIQLVHDAPNMYLAMMTNLPEICDDAVLRAGRIDKKYKFDLPNIEERQDAFVKVVEIINEKAGYKVLRGINYQRLAEMSEGYNYADIHSCVENALKKRAEVMIKSNSKEIIKCPHVRGESVEKEIKEHTEKFKKVEKRIGF